MSVITLTTDFGTGSPYVAAVKGVIHSINPKATIVDITHDIRPQDIGHGAIVLEDVCDRFPPDSIHVVVVDPGVGTDRAIVYARIGSQKYVAPDNGLLSRLAKRTPPSQIIEVKEPKYWLQPVSATFHGRDIMAPLAAHISLGVDPNLLGLPASKLLDFSWPEVQISANRLEGTVLEIDSFGNVITNITADLIAGHPTDERACVVCDLYETWGIYGTYAEHPSGALIALVGSSGRLELALVGGNAARRLGIKIGTPVTLAWE